MFKLVEITKTAEGTAVFLPWTTLLGVVVLGPSLIAWLRPAPASHASVTPLRSVDKPSEEAPKAE